MGHIIEAAKTGRASCRSCKKTIEKGDLRLGEEVDNPFAGGDKTYNWHHLECASLKKGAALKSALETTEMDVPNKDELLKAASSNAKKEKPANFPYAEMAPTNRSTCLSCGEKIEKGNLRVAIETEVDTGGFMRRGPGYLHPSCVIGHTEADPEEMLEKVKANSTSLTDDDGATLEESFYG
ncbi:MAG: hypothetical protein K2W95_19660 [Candidatus Obscuribacterales bacterium]|nr:hypothetical protein [Candidatus Obscuribacterales bacterium]